MKRIHVGKPTILSAGAAALGLVALSLVAAPAANAAESRLNLFVTECYTEGEQPPAVQGNLNAPGEIFDNILIEGIAPPGDAEYRLPAGTYNYTYDVVTIATGDSASFDGSFTIDYCVINAPAPTQDGPFVTVPSQEGSEYFDMDTNAVLTDTIQLADKATVNIDVRPSGNAPVSGGPWSFTYNAPVTPVDDPAITGVTLTPSSDGSGVDYSVTVDVGDRDQVVVLIGHVDILDASLTFEESGTQTGSFDLPCGEYEFGVFIEGSMSGPSESFFVTIPCDNPGGGGNEQPGGETPGTGGGPAAPADPKPVDTSKITAGDYQTDDVYIASGMNTEALGYGTLLAAAGLAGLAAFFGVKARRRTSQSIQG